MRLLQSIKTLFGTRAAPAASASFNPEHFVYVKLPGNIQPIQRGEQFEDRIEPELARLGLGTVSGGGSSLTEPLPDGRRLVAFCGIDIDTTDRDGALELLRELLPGLQAPTETELHYTSNGIRLKDALGPNGWSIGVARESVHPGFGV
jgi:hypothetical protein